MKTRALLIPLLLLAAACGSLLPDPAPTPRYFYLDPDVSTGQISGGDKVGSPLRLRAVTASSHLTDRIAHKVGPNEVAFYEYLRWTENPRDSLKLALSVVLYQEAGLRRVESGGAPILDVYLIGFEEVREPRHVANILLGVQLFSADRASLYQAIVQDMVPVEDDTPNALARAMGEVMIKAVRKATLELIAYLPTSDGEETAGGTPGPQPLVVASDLDNPPFRLDG